MFIDLIIPIFFYSIKKKFGLIFTHKKQTKTLWWQSQQTMKLYFNSQNKVREKTYYLHKVTGVCVCVFYVCLHFKFGSCSIGNYGDLILVFRHLYIYLNGLSNFFSFWEYFVVLLILLVSWLVHYELLLLKWSGFNYKQQQQSMSDFFKSTLSFTDLAQPSECCEQMSERVSEQTVRYFRDSLFMVNMIFELFTKIWCGLPHMLHSVLCCVFVFVSFCFDLVPIGCCCWAFFYRTVPPLKLIEAHKVLLLYSTFLCAWWAYSSIHF